MDLRQYYHKLSVKAKEITEEFPLVASLETSDGGKAGIVMEVSRATAAKLIVEGRARLATEAEALAHKAEWAGQEMEAEARELAEMVQRELARQVSEASNPAKKARPKK